MKHIASLVAIAALVGLLLFLYQNSVRTYEPTSGAFDKRALINF